MCASATSVPQRSKARTFFYSAVLIGSWCINASSQERAERTKNFVFSGQQFLKLMYPELSGKKYFMTLETSILYDSRADHINDFDLYVGEARKDIIRGYAGGCMGTTEPSPQFSYPSNSGTVPAASTSLPLPQSTQASSLSVHQSEQNCPKGAVYPKQILTTGFRYNDDRLVVFNATGPAIGNPDAYNTVSQLAYEHPDLSSEHISSALKQAGAKYGPADKKDFIHNLPIAILERFIGKIQLVSVEFTGLDHPILPMWSVIARAKTTTGPELTYEMMFEPFKGDLISLKTVPYPPESSGLKQ